MNKVIQTQLALLKFAILPGVLGGIACFVGPPHSALIKAIIGAVIGFSLQHKYMFPVVTIQRKQRIRRFSSADWPKRKRR